jgi:hypothetical protein
VDGVRYDPVYGGVIAEAWYVDLTPGITPEQIHTGHRPVSELEE